MNRKQTSAQPGTEGGRRPRRRVAKELVERGRRLRSRAGLLIGISMGVVALLTAMD
ncbi:hypothetical protein [Massilia sp. SYSU DXS3249]